MGRRPFMHRDDDDQGYATALIDGDAGVQPAEPAPDAGSQPILTLDHGEPPPGCRKLGPGRHVYSFPAGNYAAQKRVEDWLEADLTADFGPPLQVNDHEPQIVAPQCKRHGIALQVCGCEPPRDEQARRQRRAHSDHDEEGRTMTFETMHKQDRLRSLQRELAAVEHQIKRGDADVDPTAGDATGGEERLAAIREEITRTEALSDEGPRCHACGQPTAKAA